MFDRLSSLFSKAEAFSAVYLLVIRILLGTIFMKAGYYKIYNMDKSVEGFKSIGIHYASVMAPFVTINELVFGFLIFVGLLGRIASIPLIIIMAVAFKATKLASVTDFMSFASTDHILFGLLLFAILFFGSGALSLDRWFFKYRF